MIHNTFFVVCMALNVCVCCNHLGRFNMWGELVSHRRYLNHYPKFSSFSSFFGILVGFVVRLLLFYVGVGFLFSQYFNRLAGVLCIS